MRIKKIGAAQIADYDGAIREMNDGIEKLRALLDDEGRAKFWSSQIVSIHSLASAVERRLIPASEGLAGLSRLLFDLSKATKSCEDSHPGEACGMGEAVAFAFTVPTQMVILSSFLGFSLARGKRIK